MSACMPWIVTKAHIDALVQQMIVDGVIHASEADSTGTRLWAENHHSVSVRYREDCQAPDYKFKGIEARLDDGVILALIHCLDYQCCEWDGYENETGMQLIQRLRGRICRRHGINDVQDDQSLWANAPWGIDSIEEAIARTPSDR